MQNAPNPNIAPAHALWVELATRTATQNLHFRSGGEEAAARSVFSLFPIARKLLTEHPDAADFRRESLELLNGTLRPYTARWHSWMIYDDARREPDGTARTRFQDEPTRCLFREELEELQDRLSAHRSALARMACIEDKDGRSVRPGAELGAAPLCAGIGLQVKLRGNAAEEELGAVVQEETAGGGAAGADRVTPQVAERLNRAERARVKERRAAVGRQDADEPENALHDATGLALSGGGIRSATFCLGIVQVLVRRKLFLQFDYLSTVSGGGYLGSFLSCALGTVPPGAQVAAAPSMADIQARLDDTFSHQACGTEAGLVRHMRNNSKYLVAGGLGAMLQIASQLLSGVLWNCLVLLPLPLAAALGTRLLREAGFWRGSLGGDFPSGLPKDSLSWLAIVLLGLVTAVLWLGAPLVRLVTARHALRSVPAVLCNAWAWSAIVAGVGTCLAGLLYLIPGLFHGYGWLSERVATLTGEQMSDWVSVVSAGGGAVALGVLGTILKPHRKRLRALAVKLFIVAGPLLLLWVFLLVGQHLGLAARASQQQWPLPLVVAIAAAALLWAELFVNINTLAPHCFYRSRLCDCYLVRRVARDSTACAAWLKRRFCGTKAQGRTESIQRLPLGELNRFPAAPYHLLNTTLNLPDSDNKELRGRNGDFFVVSPEFCGAPTVGYEPTAGIEARDPHFDLGTAMAVSAAAASANMGWKTLPHFRFLMTLLNVRLGYWVRRPDAPRYRRLLRPVDFPGPLYLWRELTGVFSERCRYLNLSDGGHIENLAAYELLRRRCKFIVCVDGGQDEAMECGDLIRLQRYAEIDLGLRMTYDLTDLRLRENRCSRAYAILVKIEYPSLPGEKGDWQPGWMLYLKLAMTGIEPPYVGDYRREHPDFPHQSTGDQLYDEAQFEAYRRLGECAALSCLPDEEQPVTTWPADLRAWFQQLADKLLPDNDPAMR